MYTGLVIRTSLPDYIHTGQSLRYENGGITHSYQRFCIINLATTEANNIPTLSIL